MASAGIAVTSAGGSIVFDFTPPTEQPIPTTKTFNATIPGSDTVEFSESFTGGHGSVSYNFPTANAKKLSGSASVQIGTGAPEPDGSSGFELHFTSDVPVHYRFTASVPSPPQGFSANLDGIVATAHIDSLGNGSGSIPFDENTGEFGEFVREGTLPAGDHEFALLSSAFGSKSGGGGGAGNASIEVTAVPLPPAAWTGIAMLAGVIAVGVMRQRFASIAR